MQLVPRTLIPVYKSGNDALYEISPRPRTPPNFRTFVVTTPESRKLCADPFVVGFEYRKALRIASKVALTKGPIRSVLDHASDAQLNVLHFLRGGLSYMLMDALGELGRVGVHGSFMSSERYSTPDADHPEHHEWHIHKDQYIELNLVPHSVLLIGDISASGVTLKAGLAKIAQRYGNLSDGDTPEFVRQFLTKSKNKPDAPAEGSLKHLVFVTIGGHLTEDILREYHDFFCKLFPEYEGTSLVYVEGLFHVADDEAPLINNEPGTDLVAWNAVLAPEFEKTLQQNPWIALEACMVYDGGSRSFYPPRHYASLLEYAQKVQVSLDKGLPPFRLMADRWHGIHHYPADIKKQLNDKKLGDLWVSNRLAKVQKLLGAHA